MQDLSLPKPMLTIVELAAFLNISVRKLEQLVHDGQAPPFARIGRQRRWRFSYVESWLQERQTGSCPCTASKNESLGKERSASPKR